jgi:hypothetical protein
MISTSVPEWLCPLVIPLSMVVNPMVLHQGTQNEPGLDSMALIEQDLLVSMVLGQVVAQATVIGVMVDTIRPEPMARGRVWTSVQRDCGRVSPVQVDIRNTNTIENDMKINMI